MRAGSGIAPRQMCLDPTQPAVHSTAPCRAGSTPAPAPVKSGRRIGVQRVPGGYSVTGRATRYSPTHGKGTTSGAVVRRFPLECRLACPSLLFETNEDVLDCGMKTPPCAWSVSSYAGCPATPRHAPVARRKGVRGASAGAAGSLKERRPSPSFWSALTMYAPKQITQS